MSGGGASGHNPKKSALRNVGPYQTSAFSCVDVACVFIVDNITTSIYVDAAVS